MKRTIILLSIMVCVLVGALPSVSRAADTPPSTEGYIQLEVPIGDIPCKNVSVREGDFFYTSQDACASGIAGTAMECKDGATGWNATTKSCDDAWLKSIIVYDTAVPNSLLVAYIKLVYGYLKAIIATLVALMIVWGGVEWAVSAGNQTMVDDGKARIISALVGLVVFIIAGLILHAVNPGAFPIISGAGWKAGEVAGLNPFLNWEEWAG